MLKLFAKKVKNKKGFTLIELIVVIAILAILAAIAIPRFTGVKNNAKNAVDDQVVAQLNHAVEMYNAQNDSYPTSSTIDDAAAMVYSTVPTPQGSDMHFYYNTSSHLVLKHTGTTAAENEVLIK